MAGDYVVKARSDGEHLGRVIRYEGNPRSERWVGYSMFTEDRVGLPTRKAAMQWLAHQRELSNDRDAKPRPASG